MCGNGCVATVQSMRDLVWRLYGVGQIPRWDLFKIQYIYSMIWYDDSSLGARLGRPGLGLPRLAGARSLGLGPGVRLGLLGLGLGGFSCRRRFGRGGIRGGRGRGSGRSSSLRSSLGCRGRSRGCCSCRFSCRGSLRCRGRRSPQDSLLVTPRGLVVPGQTRLGLPPRVSLRSQRADAVLPGDVGALLGQRGRFLPGVPQPLVPLGRDAHLGVVRRSGVLDDAAPAFGARGAGEAEFPVRVALEVEAW